MRSYGKGLSQVVLVITVLLAACSTGRIVKTYEGETLSVQEVAVLTTPEHIHLISVNGKRVKKYILKNQQVKYGLHPGENLIVFQYNSVWGRTIFKDEDAPRAEEVKSRPQEVLIMVKAGDRLTFRHKSATNIREAKLLASQFKTEIVDVQGNVITKLRKSGAHQISMLEEVPETEEEPSILSTIESLKVLWASATTEEKKAFLKWALQ